MRELQQRFHCRVNFSARNEKPFIALSGCQSDVDAASGWVEGMLAEFAKTHQTIDLPELALPLFLNNGGKEAQRIQKEFDVSLQIDKSNLKMVICGDCAKLPAARSAALDLIRRITILKIPSRIELRSAFFGTKGSHIDKIRKEFHVSVRVNKADEADEIEVEGFDQNVTSAASYVQSWLNDHWVENVKEDKEIMGRVVFGAKGAIIRETEKKFKISTKQIMEAQTTLSLFGRKKNVLEAKAWMEAQLDSFRRTHFWCCFSPDHFYYSYELSRPSLAALQAQHKGLKVVYQASSGWLRCEGAEKDIAEIREKFLAFKNSTLGFQAYPCPIPFEHVGLVFGKEGKTRAYLQAKYHCRILPRRESSRLIIWGEKQAAEKASKEILSIIETNQIVSQILPITLKQFHQLLVDRCRAIRSIHVITNATLKLRQHSAGNGEVSISGTQKNVEAAKALVEAVFRGTPTYSYKYDPIAVNTLFATSSFPMKLVVLANQCNISHNSQGLVVIRGELDNIHRAHAQLYEELMNLFPSWFFRIPISKGVCHYFVSSGKIISSDDPYVLISVDPKEGFVYCMKRPEPLSPEDGSRSISGAETVESPASTSPSSPSSLIVSTSSTDPNSPVNPVGPVFPTDPINPSNSINSTNLSNSINPSNSISSSNSINPINPINPTNPSDPISPITLVDSSNPPILHQTLPAISAAELSERLARVVDAVSKEVTELSLRHVLLCIDPIIIAHIVGVKGRQIKEIIASTGAMVEVVCTNDHVYVHGEIENVRKACEQIKSIVSTYQVLNKVIEAPPSVIQDFKENYETMIEQLEEKYSGEISMDVKKGQIRISARSEKQTNDLKYTIESLLEEQQLDAERECSELVSHIEEDRKSSDGQEDSYQKEIASLLGFDSLYSCL